MAARVLTKVEPVGAVDGSNLIFDVGDAYDATTSRVWVDGVERIREDDDGWAETPTHGLVTMVEAPATGSRLFVAYVPAA